MDLVALEWVGAAASGRDERRELERDVVVRVAGDAIGDVAAEQLIPSAEVDPSRGREELRVDLGVVREVRHGNGVRVEAERPEEDLRARKRADAEEEPVVDLEILVDL